MPTKRCAWGHCNSDSRYKDQSYMHGVTFFPFPKPKTNLEKCMLWVKLCGRPFHQLNSSLIKRHTHYVCSKHFLDGNPNPIPAGPLERNTSCRKRPADRCTPSTSRPSKAKRPLDMNISTSSCTKLSLDLIDTPYFDVLFPTDTENSDPRTEIFDPHTEQSDPPSTFTDPTSRFANKSIQADSYNSFIETILSNDETCFYYTGLTTVQLLRCLFNWIEPAAQNTKLWDGKRKHIPGRKGGKKRKNHFNEYILCLVRLRQGYGSKHLAYLFNISISQVCRVFSTWVNLLSQYLEQLLVWPSKDIVKSYLPSSFIQYPNTRAIIDCTEYYVQKPLKPVAQKLTWSNYKHANTFKQLVAISPSGTIIFVSNLYSGSISDVSIVKESKFVDFVEPGDDIMADRGFNIRHLLLPKRATLNIPAFSYGKTLSRKAVNKSRKVASVRIHVERAIRRMKTFKILSGIIPIKLRFLLPQITKIVAVICNLQAGLA